MSPWLLFIVIGLITFSIRFSAFALAGRTDLPPLALRALRFVPPAVLSAVFIPEILMPGGSVDISLGNARLLAGLLAIGVAWKTKNVLLTIGAGMLAFWILQALALGK